MSLRRLLIDSTHRVNAPLANLALHGRTFTFKNRAYKYLHHWYNGCYANERAVEVPLALAAVRGKCLEVGNVLNHYAPFPHTVIDKYENWPGIINADAAGFTTEERFDSIISISTLEHMGVDEDIKESEKAIGVLERLKKFLAPGGVLFITVPVGHNAALDGYLQSDSFGFADIRAIKRYAPMFYREVPLPDVRGCRVGLGPTIFSAQGVVIAEYRS